MDERAGVRGADRRRTGTVAVDPDLAPLHILSPDGRTLPRTGDPDAEPLRFTRGANGLTGPHAWLPDEPVLTLTVVGGKVTVGGLDAVPPVDERTAERLATTLEAIAGRRRLATDEVELLIEARARYPRLLSTPQAPFGALLAAVGLAVTGQGVRPADAVDEPDDGDLVEHLREDHDLDDLDILAVLRVRTVVLEAQNALLRRQLEAWPEGTEEASEEAAEQAAEQVAAQVATEAAADLRATADGRIDLVELAGIDLDAASEDLTRALARIEAAMALVDGVIERDPLAAACLLGLLHQARPTGLPHYPPGSSSVDSRPASSAARFACRRSSVTSGRSCSRHVRAMSRSWMFPPRFSDRPVRSTSV